MFSEIPKLFDRNFIIGYFLPGALFVLANLVLITSYELYTALLASVGIGSIGVFLNQLQKDPLVLATTIGITSFLTGILLLVANRTIYQMLEGYYGPWKWLVVPKLFWRWRFRVLKKKISKKDRNYARLLVHAARYYPTSENHVLPTALGNTIRAFEVYPGEIYGIEATEGWSRLVSVIPKDYRELIEGAKAQTDFWINLLFLSWVIILEYITLFITHGYRIFWPLNLDIRNMQASWILIIAMVAALIASYEAKQSAFEWGDWLKAAFDVYLPQLIAKMRFEITGESSHADLLLAFSQASVYRLKDQMPKRALPKPEQRKKPRSTL